MSGNESRLQAIYQITNREETSVKMPKKLKKIWAEDVFNLAKMEDLLSKKAFKDIKKTVATGEALDPATADAVAAAMKDWAIAKGAKFFSHIFYPMTGATAEKHDGFIVSNPEGNAITEFTGSLLIKGEPDGSSFPNGGIRLTNAARGYTAWDPSSPAYLMQTANGPTLMIPSVFLSWTGESLDKKIPLLRSNAAMNTAAQKVLKLMGETDITTLNSSCGAEQEYFLVDANFAAARPDLLLAGRTLFGAPAAKGQEFDDHYFGAIPPRVQVFMKDFENTLYKLGIPVKTHHNEVAPGQFEIAPYFEAANVAADHQQLLMTVLKNTAKKHGFLCLLHEKPFAGINGSGKHVNWSVGNSTQGNLLDPGNTPHKNLNFLLFCGAVIRGVHKYGPLLRAVIASAGNDHRLGANEAPPAILSVYLGEQLEKIFNDIKEGKLTAADTESIMDLGLSQIINFTKDAGDRNRTSPFAFTGNRFEFRMVGSAQSIAGPNFVLNTIVAEALCEIANQLEKARDAKAAVQKILTQIAKDHSNVVFNGDNYADAWVQEAKKRGLPNIVSSVEAIETIPSKENCQLFKKYGVLSPAELKARTEVLLEQYSMKINIEACTTIDMAKRQILPTCCEYAGNLGGNIASVNAAGVNADTQVGMLEKVNDLIAQLHESIGALEDAQAKASNIASVVKQARAYRDDVIPAMNAVRKPADELENLVDASLWPLPTYAEMLFIR